MLTQRTGSTEDKPPEPADCALYEEQVRELITQKHIDPRALFLLDEFNDFKYLPPKTVVTSRRERETSGPTANQKRWAPQKSGGRKTVTCGLGLTPTWMARAYVLTDQASNETQALVRDVLGHHVVLFVNTTGNVHGHTHVNSILNKYLAVEQKKMKEVLALDQSEPWFFGEDHAPGHYHDDCSVTKTTGLNQQRKDFFTSNNCWRKLTPKKGTPRYMVGDQLHACNTGFLQVLE